MILFFIGVVPQAELHEVPEQVFVHDGELARATRDGVDVRRIRSKHSLLPGSARVGRHRSKSNGLRTPYFSIRLSGLPSPNGPKA